MRHLGMCLALVALFVLPAVAQEAQAPPPGEAMQVTVVSVDGQVEKLVAGGPADRQQWEPVKAGDKLDERTVIRTGFRSKAVLRFDDRGEVVVNNATKMGIAEFRRQGNLTNARLGLKYGTMRASVDASRGPNDVRVSTPVATLSIRGTGGEIGHSADRGLGLLGFEGVWRVASGDRTRDISPGEETDTLLTPPIDLAKFARENLLGDFFGLTPIERQNLIFNPPTLNPSTPTGGRPIDTVVGPLSPTDGISPPPDHVIIGL